WNRRQAPGPEPVTVRRVVCIRLAHVERGREELDLVPFHAPERLADDVEEARPRVVDDDGVAGDRERAGAGNIGVVREERESRRERLRRPGGAAIGRVRDPAAVIEVPVVPHAQQGLAVRAHPERLLVGRELVVGDLNGCGRGGGTRQPEGGKRAERRREEHESPHNFLPLSLTENSTNQTLKRTLRTSPSSTTYVLPSSCCLPARAASACPPDATRSSQRTISQRMKPRAMSEWIVSAASSAVSPRLSVQARVSLSPAVKNVIRSRVSASRRTTSPSADSPPPRNSPASSGERSTSSASSCRRLPSSCGPVPGTSTTRTAAGVTLRASTTCATASSRSSGICAIPTCSLPEPCVSARVSARNSVVLPELGSPTIPTSSATRGG